MVAGFEVQLSLSSLYVNSTLSKPEGFLLSENKVHKTILNDVDSSFRQARLQHEQTSVGLAREQTANIRQ